MMVNLNPRLLVLAAGLAIFADASRASQPTDSVVSDGNLNTAMGTFALDTMSSGAVANTAAGYAALYSNTTGSYNAAFGVDALLNSTTADGNTAVGYAALSFNSTGASNTAAGSGALQSNTVGNDNSAFGNTALSANTTGASNTAAGFQALYTNSTGANNTAFGTNALYSNTTGKGNAAQGAGALYSNTTGIRNLGIGNNALYGNTTGSYNIGLGVDGGYNVTTGSNNIEIGASGTASDDGTIQIGVQGTQTSTTIAGISGTQVTGGSAVYVTSTGQLGVQGSSERFKTDIAPMPELSETLQQLRPVTFRYKTDPKGVRQYGLIAEEVAKVYPELVIRDDSGKIMGVHYEELAPMLLNELQKQQAAVKTLSEQNALQATAMRKLEQRQQRVDAQEEAIGDLRRQVADLNEMYMQLRAKQTLVAKR